MADIVNRQTRSRMMSGIQGKNTRPEMIVRKGLFAAGFRYRLHGKDLPGRPDLVLRPHNAVIFVNGCFWHGHDCHLFKWPSTRRVWWREKIKATRRRDRQANRLLSSQGWRILTLWECALKGRTRMPETDVIQQVVAWLESERPMADIAGVAGVTRIRKKK